MPIRQPLEARFNSLPLILCGPIVRRVETDIVSVWLALKEERHVVLEIYSGYCSPADNDFTGKQIAFSSQKIKTVKVGEHLHLALLTIATVAPASTGTGVELPPLITLAPGAVYSYNILFYKTTDGVTDDENLIKLGLLNAPELLGFIPKQLPSFIVAPVKLEELRIAHGSCRKPHGPGRDALATLAKIIEPDFTEADRKLKPTARPHYFFHTGDQIYADDCTDFLIQHYTDAANFLLQRIEELPFPKIPENNYTKQGSVDANFIQLPVTSAVFPPGRRATNFYSGFTGAQSNHLYSFGEFCAAYLFQWCDVLWPRKQDNPNEIELSTSEEVYFDRLNDTAVSRTYLFPLTKTGDKNKDGELESTPQVPANWDTVIDTRRDRFNAILANVESPANPGTGSQSDQIAENKILAKAFVNYKRSRQRKFPTDEPKEKDLVEDFARDLKASRRVMANMASIMSFDDHDITDDWYLSGAWTKQATGTRLGESIIRNGLCAFALFQAWGNDPRGWAEQAEGKNARYQLLQEIPALVQSFTPINPGDTTVALNQNKFKVLLGFAAFNGLPPDDPRVKWHCFINIGPAKVFVLDTRTRRDFSKGLVFPPNLIEKNALLEQIPDNALPFGTELAIVISGAPVLGLTAIEAIGQPLIPRVLDVISVLKEPADEWNTRKRQGIHKGRDSVDVEHWSLHQEGFEAFLKRCATLKRVLFLAGDVHYGIASEMDYWVKGAPEAARFVQMVSSSLKNAKPSGQLVGLLPAGITEVALSGGFNKEFLNITSIGWETPADIEKVKLRVQTEPGKFADARPAHYPIRLSYAMAKKPILLTLRDWPLKKFESATPGEPPKILNRIVFNRDCPEPAFRWKMNVKSDERPDSERFQALTQKPPGVTTDLTVGTYSGDDYQKILDTIIQRSGFYSRSHINRTVNWYSHVALINFYKNVETFFTRQSMFFYPLLEGPDINEAGSFEKPFLRYELSLGSKPAIERPDFPLEPTT